MGARRRQASALRVRHSQSFASRRALPGHFEVGRQPEAVLAAWALKGWEKIFEQPLEDGPAHGRQARRRRRSGKSTPHFFPVPPGSFRRGDDAAGQRRLVTSSAREMQPSPRAALEVVEAELLLELLVSFPCVAAAPALVRRPGRCRCRVGPDRVHGLRSVRPSMPTPAPVSSGKAARALRSPASPIPITVSGALTSPVDLMSSRTRAPPRSGRWRAPRRRPPARGRPLRRGSRGGPGIAADGAPSTSWGSARREARRGAARRR